jgi:hypothetical protein
MMFRMLRSWVIALAVATGCGPIAYVNQVTREASQNVERARRLEADKFSPYWWTRATVYLAMAREVAAHADFQGANRFGRLASEAAVNAAEEATLVKQDPSKGPIRPTLGPATDGVAPAKEAP